MAVSDDLVTEVVRDNAASLLRLARQHSICDDDAADAYQKTLVIYLERVDRVDHATAGAWLRTVCKHEAIRLRAARQRVAPSDPMEWDEQPAADPHDAEERASSLERVARAAEALRACRPEEARAMLLRADGSSYAEIGELCGWSYSKVNRSLADGRARFLARFARIESGAACAGYAHLLSAIVDGEATPDDYLRLRPHLRHCLSCRSTLKAMYESEPALGALVPAGALVLAVPDGPGFLARAFASVATEVGDRLVRAHAVFEAATTTKAAAVVASTAAAAAGGAAAVDRDTAARAAAPAKRVAAHASPAPGRRGAVATPSPGGPAEGGATPAPVQTVGAGAHPQPTSTPTPAPTPEPSPVATPPPPVAEHDEFGVEDPPPAPVTPPAQAPTAFERTGGGSAGQPAGDELGFEG